MAVALERAVRRCYFTMVSDTVGWFPSLTSGRPARCEAKRAVDASAARIPGTKLRGAERAEVPREASGGGSWAAWPKKEEHKSTISEPEPDLN